MIEQQPATIKRDNFYIYLFCANFNQLRNSYGNRLKIQLDNIKELFKHSCGSEWQIIADDPRSLTIAATDDNGADFARFYEFSQKLTATNDFLQDICRDHEVKTIMHGAIILGADFRGNQFKRCGDSIINNTSLPFLLLSEKAAISIIESYNVFNTGLVNIWLTDGVIVSEIDRLQNIFLDRPEGDEIEKFLNEDTEPLMLVHGGLGSGKTSLILDSIRHYDGETEIIYVSEEKHSEREFNSVVKILEALLFKLIDIQTQTTADLIDIVTTSALSEYSRKNLIDLVQAYFTESEEDFSVIDYEMILTRLKFAIQDAARLHTDRFNIPIGLIVDNRQFISTNCESVILTLLNTLNSLPVKIIMVDREKNIPAGYPVKELAIEDLSPELTEKYLKLCFPHKIITRGLVKIIHDITGGNIFCLKEYLHYLLSENAIVKTSRHLKIGEISATDIPDNLQDLFLKKIEKLDSNSLNILKLTTIFGDSVSYSDLDTILHSLNYPGDDNTALDNLEKSGILAKDGSIYFHTEDEISRTLYNSIPKNNRVLTHNILGEMYEKKGLKPYAFKTFFHYYRAENYDKLFALLPDMLKAAHQELKYNALRNMLNLSETILYSKIKSGQEELIPLWRDVISYRHNLNDKSMMRDNARILDKALTMDYFINNHAEGAELHLKLVDFYSKEKNFPKAQEVIDKAMVLATEHQMVQINGELQIRQASLALSQNNLARATEALHLAETAFNETKNEIRENTVYLKVAGWLNLKQKNYPAALEADRQLLALAGTHNHLSKIYHLTENVAQLALYTKEYEFAEKCYHNLLMLSINFGEIDRYNDITLKLAVVYSYQNKFRQSIAIINTLLSFPDMADNRDFLLKIYTKSGLIYQYFNEEAPARKAFTQLNNLALEMNNEVNTFYSFYRLGMLSLYNNQFHTAHEHFEKAKKQTGQAYYQQLTDLCLRINRLGISPHDNDELKAIIAQLQAHTEKMDREILFELYLCLINIMYFKKYFHKIKEILPLANELQPYITDYNKIAALKNIIREIGKASMKNKVSISQEHKVHPSIKKVVKRRYTRSAK